MRLSNRAALLCLLDKLSLSGRDPTLTFVMKLDVVPVVAGL